MNKAKMNKLEIYIDMIKRELESAQIKFPAFNSYHEGYAVILEELDELWDEIKNKASCPESIEYECIQTAAMCLRFLVDLGIEGEDV